MDNGYNGWKNYETWAVKLWIDNEEYTQRMWAERTEDVRLLAESEHGEHFTAEDWARIHLSDELKEWAEVEMPDLGPSMWADLLNAAFSEVDWLEIADNMLSDT